MPLLTYKDARPWAKAMKTAVLARKMPPWFAEAGVGHFENDRRLSPSEISTLTQWADAGAPEGNAKDAPKPLSFTNGWSIGQPDKIYEMPQAFEVPASGVINYQWVRIPSGFTEGTWIRGIELRPGDRSVVHHIALMYRLPNSKWMADAPVGVAIPKPPGGSETGGSNGLCAEYVPGLNVSLYPEGSAQFFPAGTDFFLQLHYTPNGKPARDRTSIGIVYAKEPPKMRYMFFGVANFNFEIPAGASAQRIGASATLGMDIRVLDLQPHMHLRGKSFEFSAVYPDGRNEKLLNVPNYDFNWQIACRVKGEMILPKGTRIEASGVFDNSANNARNPDPTAVVRAGEQTTDEMMAGIIHIMVPVNADLRNLIQRTPYIKPADGEF